jgi:hypothetical protein
MAGVREDVAKLLAEEPAVETTISEPQMYRVRKSWSDAKSQAGAYKVLDNAKKCCDVAGEGYKVYDSSGTEVYAYKAVPVEVSEEELNTSFKVDALETPPAADLTVRVDDQKATNIATLIFNTIKKLLQLLVEAFNNSK